MAVRRFGLAASLILAAAIGGCDGEAGRRGWPGLGGPGDGIPGGGADDPDADDGGDADGDGETDGETEGDDAGTGSDDGGNGGPPDEDIELVYVEVDPAEVVLELDLGEASAVPFTVIGHYTDGATEDLTDEAAFSVSNPFVGYTNENVLQVPAHGQSFFDSTIVEVEVGSEHGAAQVTLAAYRKTGESPDFFFVLPYEDPAGPQDKPLTFSTEVQSLDVFFNVDTTGSMSPPIHNLQSSLVSIIGAIQGQVADTQFGVGSFEDFPISGYGNSPCYESGVADQPFTLLQEITNSAASAQAAVNALTTYAGGPPIGCGADTPESNVEALYQIATGDGLNSPAPTSVPANADGVGGVAFRDGVLPVIVPITDAVTHQGNGCGQNYGGSVAGVAATEDDAMSALAGICGRVMQVAVGNHSGSCSPLDDGRRFAETTGAVIPPEAWDQAAGGRPAGCGAGQCCTGTNSTGVPTNAAGMCPLVYRANSNGSGLDHGIIDGVQMLAAYAPFEVTTAVDGVPHDTDGMPADPGVTSADFITAITPDSHGPVPLPGAADPTLTPTTFQGVIPDTDVTFSVSAHNTVVPQGDYPRLFEATISVLASGCSELDERQLYVLVPPKPLPLPS